MDKFVYIAIQKDSVPYPESNFKSADYFAKGVHDF